MSNLRKFRFQSIIGALEHLLAIQKQAQTPTYEAGKGAARHYDEMFGNAEKFQKREIECTVGPDAGHGPDSLAGGIMGREQQRANERNAQQTDPFGMVSPASPREILMTRAGGGVWKSVDRWRFFETTSVL